MTRKVLHSTWYGTFIIDIGVDPPTIVDSRLAKMDPGSISEDLLRMNNGEVIDRERELSLREDISAVSDPRLSVLFEDPLIISRKDLKAPSPEDMGFETILLQEASIILAGKAPREGPDDSTIMSGVGALTDIDSSLNLITERMREWYSKYIEGIDEILDDREALSKVAEDPDPASLGSRMEIDVIPEPTGEVPDISGMSELARVALSLWEAREKMERYVENEMESSAPNLSLVVGPLIGARLIHSAGGLVRLSRLPASTVQVLGAEKMFFKFLKEGGKPPKHGVLFQHPWVHSLPAQKRGKMSRSIANAASLASRMDAYGGGDASPLKTRLEQRREQILKMEVKERKGGGRQPPFREGWWADKPVPKKGRGPRNRGKWKRK